MQTKTLEIAARHGNKADALLEIFHDVQHEFGYVPEDVLQPLAKALTLSRAEVYGVLTFYHDFKRAPQGRHSLKLCRAEACQSMGCDALIAGIEKHLGVKLGETSKDGRITVEAVYCLGLCASAPAALVNEKPKAKLTLDKLQKITAELA